MWTALGVNITWSWLTVQTCIIGVVTTNTLHLLIAPDFHVVKSLKYAWACSDLYRLSAVYRLAPIIVSTTTVMHFELKPSINSSVSCNWVKRVVSPIQKVRDTLTDISSLDVRRKVNRTPGAVDFILTWTVGCLVTPKLYAQRGCGKWELLHMCL